MVMVQGAAQTVTSFVCTEDVEVEPGVDVAGPAGPVDVGLDGICTSTAISLGLDPYEVCGATEEDDTSEVTPGLVGAAFKLVPIPPSNLMIQPPNGRTLVNFQTNFFAEPQPVDARIALLGQQVELHIVPKQFLWQFGDGESAATAEPGAPYPALDVTHRYLTKGRVAPSVDTTYTATFRVNGGPWRDVPGSVTIPGAPVDLQVLTATPTLVGYGRG
ncbi:hypothetical protein [Nocardioides halotolerans]|uniref:hypothetical protein n=1 Tax=Nocardioides halotolerans TaxID=433660 RepID=UPI00048E31D3|nr:hypothetical protein [Nocardioides halotolerans]